MRMEYRDAAARQFKRNYSFDLRAMSEQSRLVANDVHSIGDKIREMQADTRGIRDKIDSLRTGIDYVVASLPRWAHRPADVRAVLKEFETIWTDHRHPESGVY